MSIIKPLPVGDLILDLHNYRTVPQKSEEKSVHALISIDPDYFWALTESLLDDGWHGTENVLILDDGAAKVVKEGNRRIGAIKLILGEFKLSNFVIPQEIKAKIEAISATWKTENAEVPCNIFSKSEEAKVERLVGLTHGKGEKAGRLAWNAVARARFNRDEASGSEPALDLLEKYLKQGKNIDSSQKERWGGEYPLSVLDEALKKLAPRIGAADARAASLEYSKTSNYINEFENLLHDIGEGALGFPTIRNQAEDFLVAYQFPAPPAPPVPLTPAPGPAGSPAPAGPSGVAPGGAGTGKGVTKPTKVAPKTLPLSDPKSVPKELRAFVPKGKNSSKIVDLLIEAKKLNIEETPIAFCLVFRSMLEISVRDYCSANRLPFQDTKGGKTKEKSLADLLVDSGSHLVSSSADTNFKGRIKTAAAEVKAPHGLLSVPTMNALVHSPTATITPGNILAGFHKVFPLLVALNK